MIVKQKAVPEFKELRFRTPKELQKWLAENSKYHIRFFDFGQDLLGVYLDEGGEILQTELPSLGRVFNGKIVNLLSIHEGEYLEFIEASEERSIGQRTTIKYPILEVTKL